LFVNFQIFNLAEFSKTVRVVVNYKALAFEELSWTDKDAAVMVLKF